MGKFVKIRKQGSDVIGSCPANALAHWKERGYEEVDAPDTYAAPTGQQADEVNSTERDDSENATKASTPARGKSKSR